MPSDDLEDRAALALEVIAAFEAVPPPARDDIAPHPCDECDDLATALDGIAPTDVLNAAPSAVWDLPLLSAEAKRYYLPGWLLPAIADPQHDAVDALLFALDSDHRWDPAGGYTEAQRAVLTRTLEAMVEHVSDFDSHALLRALERWSA